MNVADHLRDLEQQLHRSSVRKSAADVNALLRDDFEEYGASGRIYTKPEIIATLREESHHKIEMLDFRADLLTNTVALVRYRSISTRLGSPPFSALRSSLWTLENGAWRMIFHQGTKTLNQPAAESVKDPFSPAQ